MCSTHNFRRKLCLFEIIILFFNDIMIVLKIKMKIGKVKLKNNLILAPMLGVNCNSFRLQCKEHGAGLVTTAMIHPDSLLNQESKLDIIKQERPVAAQIVGRNPEDMARAASMLEKEADIIDINLGCPDKDVLGKQAGAFLIKHLDKMEKMVSKVIDSVNCAVTAKIRIGWDNKSINAVEIAKLLEDLGVNAITVHGRTRKQGYTGNADWKMIKQVKDSVNVPVIGNGDVFEPKDYGDILQKTNVDFVMIGRGAIGNPLIFENCLIYSKGKGIVEKNLEEAYKLFLEFLDYYGKYSTRESFTEIRQHAMWFLKGVKNSSVLKSKMSQMQGVDEIKNAFLHEVSKK